jgi:hypothetical protein
LNQNKKNEFLEPTFILTTIFFSGLVLPELFPIALMVGQHGLKFNNGQPHHPILHRSTKLLQQLLDRQT